MKILHILKGCLAVFAPLFLVACWRLYVSQLSVPFGPMHIQVWKPDNSLLSGHSTWDAQMRNQPTVPSVNFAKFYEIHSKANAQIKYQYRYLVLLDKKVVRYAAFRNDTLVLRSDRAYPGATFFHQGYIRLIDPFTETYSVFLARNSQMVNVSICGVLVLGIFCSCLLYRRDLMSLGTA